MNKSTQLIKWASLLSLLLLLGALFFMVGTVPTQATALRPNLRIGDFDCRLIKGKGDEINIPLDTSGLDDNDPDQSELKDILKKYNVSCVESPAPSSPSVPPALQTGICNIFKCTSWQEGK